MRRFFLSGLLLFLSLSAAARPAEPDLKDALIEKGLNALYNLDYAEAKEGFKELTARYPDSSAGLYAQTTALWWELTNEFDEENPSLEREFLAMADRTADLARKNIKEGDPTGQERLCLGGALGLKSRWEAIQGQWIKAYFNGRKAVAAQKEAIKINPELYDAYLGVGIYNYYTAVLPGAVKVLARIVAIKGDRSEGLKQIDLAMKNGLFSRTAAQLFLVNIYLNNEKNPAEALRLIREGRKEFPQSSFFHVVEMLALEASQDWPALRAQAEDYMARIDKGVPSYRKTYANRGYYFLGNSYLGEKAGAKALAAYGTAIRDHASEDRWTTMVYLNRGKAHDLLGQRDQAVSDYKAVLKRRDVWQLHDQAKKLLNSKPT